MGVFEDETDRLAGESNSIDQRIKDLQAMIDSLQAEKADVQQRASDLQDAYLAWKGIPLTTGVAKDV